MSSLWGRVETHGGGAREPRRSGAPRAGIAAVVASVLALVVVPAAWPGVSVQGSLSRVASALAGQPVTVVCTRLPGLEGEVDAQRVSLDLDTCAPLLRRAARGPDNVDAAESAAALAHEVGHVLLGSCEYRAERYAMAHWREVYRALGLGTPDSVQAVYVLSMHQALPAEYLAPAGGC